MKNEKLGLLEYEMEESFKMMMDAKRVADQCCCLYSFSDYVKAKDYFESCQEDYFNEFEKQI